MVFVHDGKVSLFTRLILIRMLAEMASLEELLLADGFKGRRSSVTSSRPSFREEAMSMPVYPFGDKNKAVSSSSSRIKTERARSDLSRYTLKSDSPRTSNLSGRRPRDSLVRREKVDSGSMKEQHRERLAGRRSVDVQERRRSNAKSSETSQENEIVEVAGEESQRVSINLDKRHSNVDNRKSMKENEPGYDRYNRSSMSRKSIKENYRKHESVLAPASEPALDEVAVQAIVSILSGYVKSFLKNEDFRATLRRKCFSSLNFIEPEDEGNSNESKVIASLEQAIETVQRAAEESASSKELKKASLQLSMITGMSANDLKDGSTSGVPNSKPSACAHLYLSVIYKIQKKDRVSAKHLLQVFCDSPFMARTTLLPELWDYLISPHLAHLKAWYKQEADSLADESNKPRKMKLLEKVYNEILDSGTYQFAVYYKDWLTEGIEAPSVPTIQIPSLSVQRHQRKGSFGNSSEVASPAAAFSPQPTVSKKLYDAVFARASKPRADAAEDDGEMENFDNYTRSSGGSTVEKRTLTYSSEIVKCTYQDTEDDSPKIAQDDIFHPVSNFTHTYPF